MKFKKKTILFRTIVGSHMWGQEHEGSDKDTFECYIFDSRSFLLGNRHDGGHKSKNEEKNEEKDSFEIGHVIRMLLKGNINFLWGVMSPKIDLCVTNIDPTMWGLRRITEQNLSKATMYSVKGFAIHNLKHWYGLILNKKPCELCDGVHFYIKESKPPRLLPEDKKYWKILNTCARTLDFGIKLLKDGVLDFENPRTAMSPNDVILMLTELEQAYKKSTLPDKPNPEPFEEYLLDTRFADFARVRNR